MVQNKRKKYTALANVDEQQEDEKEEDEKEEDQKEYEEKEDEKKENEKEDEEDEYVPKYFDDNGLLVEEERCTSVEKYVSHNISEVKE